MIKNTLNNTKLSTFYVNTPSHIPQEEGFPRPSGTGFFISATGFCLTARHVLFQKDKQGKPILNDKGIPELIEGKSIWFQNENMMLIQGVEIIKDWPQFDIILMKININALKQKEYFKEKETFDFLEIEFNIIPEGEKIYSFGYPLSEAKIQSNPGIMVGTTNISPRVTSAIISSYHKAIGSVRTPNDPKFYVIDKALNYGNSGGPIVVEENGKVISVCTQFQPVLIPQQNGFIMTPSLYGVTSSLKNIETELNKLIQ